MNFITTYMYAQDSKETFSHTPARNSLFISGNSTVYS
jgi:hypothetical protein